MRLVESIAQDIVQPIATDIDGWSWEIVQQALFSNGEQGLFAPIHDLRQLGRLYQDTAGTTPAAAVNDPVARPDDLSGNGNNPLQSTATARPLLKQDANGNWYAKSGTDDSWLLPSSLLSVDQDAAMVFAFSLDATTNFPCIFGGTGDTGIQFLFPSSGSTPRIGVKTANGFFSNTASEPVVLGTRYVFTVRWKRAAGVLTLHQNRSKVAERVVTPADIAPPADNYAIFTQGTQSVYANASLYSAAIASGPLNESAIALAEDYAASLAGVTL